MKTDRQAIWLKRLAQASICLVLALGAIWLAARPAAPPPFYDAAAIGPAAPGTLLRWEPFATALPPATRGWRILYATTRPDQSPAIASAIVLAPVANAGAPHPVIAWAHGTTGLAPGCAPSVSAAPFANVPALDSIASEGWAFVATDYIGLGTQGGHAYLVGNDAARSVLDAVRAARQLTDLRLDDRTVVWGHSQGGNSALWTGIQAPAYAPELRIVGIAALAPATDLAALVRSSRASMFGKIVTAYLMTAYSRAYPDVQIADYVGFGSRFVAEDIAGRCVGGWPTLVSALATQLLPRDGIFTRDPLEGALARRLAENTPLAPIGPPVLIAQGELDDLVLPSVQLAYVESRCAAGQVIDYRTYDGLDHISLVGKASKLSADLVEWTKRRIEGLSVTSKCAQHTR